MRIIGLDQRDELGVMKRIEIGGERPAGHDDVRAQRQ